jgi:hypothetical protein
MSSRKEQDAIIQVIAAASDRLSHHLMHAVFFAHLVLAFPLIMQAALREEEAEKKKRKIGKVALGESSCISS